MIYGLGARVLHWFVVAVIVIFLVTNPTLVGSWVHDVITWIPLVSRAMGAFSRAVSGH